MAQVRNNESQFGGEYMIQDRDHMSEIDQAADDANRGRVRQSEQSQSGGRQQGGDDSASGQQGSGDHSANRQQGGGRRQNY
jgi:hypothetical protein